MLIASREIQLIHIDVDFGLIVRGITISAALFVLIEAIVSILIVIIVLHMTHILVQKASQAIRSFVVDTATTTTTSIVPSTHIVVVHSRARAILRTAIRAVRTTAIVVHSTISTGNG